MSRIKVNLTLEAEVVAKARDLGLNMSRLAEAAIVEACKAEQNRRWREENYAAIEAYGEEVASGAVRSSETVPKQGRNRG
ncbi:type II toxin-antitoxin system CcdA family antitoxin [Shimia sp. R9_3]|uniref:type II toxin-antitoxin system CcdA family antitoxin n=1 Tax=Shimia sp. R9_3 TaxID=2821113 RepID=UPI001ADD0D64|nr:type II toxin-antitoxin system CcdA family antitoxin [Shimia sp. R9_3]MBO9402647.1 type II toxin-antitoxin system CcdA family antitoxin [Shimia sp. R9_3]